MKMPMERLAVLAAIQTVKHNGHNNGNSTSENGNVLQGYDTSNSGSGRAGRFDTDLDGNVNVLLGGAMMSGVIISVLLMCCCCHKNIRKHRLQEYSLYWRAEPEVHSPEVFTTNSMLHEQQTPGVNYEEETISLPCPSSLGPPPTYDSLMFNPHSFPSPSDKNNESFISDETQDVPKQATVGQQATKEMPTLRENEGLPSYAVALKLEADGYV